MTIIAFTTFPEQSQAKEAANTLIKERLAACVQVLPKMDSTYEWEGKIETSAEHLVLIKTTSELMKKLEARLYELHPYSTPEFVCVSSEYTGHRYLSWLTELLDPKRP